MKPAKPLEIFLLGIALLAVGPVDGQAQTTANWIGPASGGEWNNGANWDTTAPPLDSTTNAFIGAGSNVNYNLPMSAAGFGLLTNNGVLNVNAGGFNCAAIALTVPTGGDRLFLNNGAVVNVTGNFIMGTNAAATLAAGGSLTVGSLLVDAGTSSHAAGTSCFTNSGGILTATSTSVNPGTGTGTGLLVISGGTNSLGTTIVGRNNAGASFATLGTEGLIIYNGVVTMASLNVGNNGNGASSLTALVAGGTVTNTGNVLINQGTAGRASRLLQTGGLFVTPDPSIINPNSTASPTAISILSILGGTNITGGLSFGDIGGLASTVRFTNAATIYVGSQGINWNGVITLNAALNNGGLFGATTDWTGAAPMSLNGSGSFTFQAADMDGTPHAINLTGGLGGPSSIALNKTGSGTLTLGVANTYSGSTLINAGTLALGASGSLASGTIIVGSGTVFDVSALGGAYTLNSGQTLAGSGTINGAVTMAVGATVNPGSNALAGTLTFANGLTETGDAANGAINHLDLSGNPSGPNNDLINVAGDFTASGTNTVQIGGALQPGATYKLLQYSGNFNGSIANFVLSGAAGTLTNNTAAKTISFIVPLGGRTPTNITWLGNPLTNNWDTANVTNWSIKGTGPATNFISGDNVLFDNTGAANPLVNIVGIVTPGSVAVNTTAGYSFTGNGSIGGTGGLSLTNGTLTVATTNTYTGPTVLNGGILEALLLTNGGAACSLGQATADPNNLVFNGGTLRYSGGSVSIDRGATFNPGVGVFDITNSSTTLTDSGSLTGNGGLTKVGPGTLNLTGGNTYAGVTTASNGTLQVSAPSSLGTNTLVLAGGTVSIASSSSQVFYACPINVILASTLIVNGGNANNIIGSSSGSGSLSGSDTLNLSIPSAGGFCTFNADISAYAGTLQLGGSLGTLRFNSGGNSSSAQQCVGSPLATFDLGTGSAQLLNRNGGRTNYYLGALTGGTDTSLRGATTGSPNGYQIGDNNQSTLFRGTITDGSVAGAVVSIVKTGSGTLALAGPNSYTGTTTVSNGVLALTNNPDTTQDASIGNSATVNVTSGTFLDVSGLSTPTLIINASPSQVLEGRGTIRGSLAVNGTVAPGGGPLGGTGTLTVTNSISLGGITWMKLNRANSPNSDQLVSSLSSITYGGTLIVTNVGVRLHASDTFTLFSGTGLNAASFSTVTLPNYYTWNTSQLGVNGSISVATVLPPPAISSVNFSGLAGGSIAINASNGAPFGLVIVLVSTNLTQPLSAWTPVATNNFDGVGNLSSLSVPANPALPRQFFILAGY